MADYRAKPGMEDRHGEMTGAISINMMMSMLPVTVWAVFIGPLIFTSVWPTFVIAMVMAVVLSIGCVPLSRRIWARISDYMDGDAFGPKDED